MLTEFKRIKHGDMPGDVSKRLKIAMREKKTSHPAAPVFRKYIQEKGKTVQRRRDKNVIEQGLSDV